MILQELRVHQVSEYFGYAESQGAREPMGTQFSDTAFQLHIVAKGDAAIEGARGPGNQRAKEPESQGAREPESQGAREPESKRAWDLGSQRAGKPLNQGLRDTAFQ
jgi:hypothetical protein